MIDIWNYNGKRKVKVTTKESVFYGSVVCVMNTEENGREEDDITIETVDGRFIGFMPSEIESIEVIE